MKGPPRLPVLQAIDSLWGFFLLAFLLAGSAAGDPGDFDPGFSPRSSLSGAAYSIAQLPDGKILIGGGFSDVGGEIDQDHVIRLFPDGSLDTEFTRPAGLADIVRAIIPLPDGKLLVAGDFTDVAGNPDRDRLVRLHPNGSLDSGFTPPAELNGSVYTIALQADGKVLVAGDFTDAGGDSDQDYIIRLLPNGSLDPDFTAPPGLTTILGLALVGDGKILVGGAFTDVGGNLDRDSIVRLHPDGSDDEDFIPPAGLNGATNAIVVQPDGRILVGGFFFDVAGDSDRDRLIRLLSNGTLDSTFNPPPGLSSDVLSLALQTDGKVLIGGIFADVAADPDRDYCVRLNASGTLDPEFKIPIPLSDWLNGLALDGRGGLFIAGFFTNAGGVAGQDRFIRVESGPVTNSLSVPSVSTALWMRGGASPEVSGVEFAVSKDGGANYTPLGPGVRIAGGWKWTGPTLPAAAKLRARAHFQSGQYAASISIIEETINYALTRAPSIRLRGRKRFAVTRSRVTLRGTASDPDGDLRAVRFLDSRPKGRRLRPANGTANWSAVAQLRKGQNPVRIRAFDSRGVSSTPLRVTILRR